MTFNSAALRTGIAGATTVAIVGLGLTLGATSASAAPSDSEIIAANSGTITIDVGDTAGVTVTVIAEVPGSTKFLPKSATTDEDGKVEITNFSGPVSVSTEQSSAPSADLAQTGSYTPNAAIYRGATVNYEIVDGQPVLVGEAPAPVIPNSDDLEKLQPIADFNFAPTSFTKGEAFTVTFSDVALAATGETLNGVAVNNYGYSDPVFISASTIAAGSYSYVVPVEYTTQPHTLASYDAFGRVVTAITLDGGVAKADTPQTPASLANTGSGDVAPLALTALAALAFGALAFAGTSVLSARRSGGNA